MKKDILMITHFNSFFNETGNSRFLYLVDLMKDKEFNIEVISSSFSHIQKKQRNFENLERLEYKLTLIKEPGYKKNVSLKRIFSHRIMAKNLRTYLSMRKIPDIIYCSIPSLEVAKVAAEYAENNNIKFIIDIQDLWPEAFKMVFNIPILKNIIYNPMIKKANYIYSKADEIIAVSNTYKERAMNVNKKFNNSLAVYLGTDLEYFDKISDFKNIKKNNDFFKIAYVGTLGHSYDIKVIIDAIEILYKNGINNIEFLVIGDGPLKCEFEKYSKNKLSRIKFLGRLEYCDMAKELVRCDIAVNPIKKGSAGSIINKVGDYAAAGLPVINTQECNEYRNLIDKYKIGFNCNNGDFVDISEKILKLYNDHELRNNMGINNRKLSEDMFDRKKNYRKIIEIING